MEIDTSKIDWRKNELKYKDRLDAIKVLGKDWTLETRP
jgi:hypothetical protein